MIEIKIRSIEAKIENHRQRSLLRRQERVKALTELDTKEEEHKVKLQKYYDKLD